MRENATRIQAAARGRALRSRLRIVVTSDAPPPPAAAARTAFGVGTWSVLAAAVAVGGVRTLMSQAVLLWLLLAYTAGAAAAAVAVILGWTPRRVALQEPASLQVSLPAAAFAPAAVEAAAGRRRRRE